MGNGSSKKIETAPKEEKAVEHKLSRPINTGQAGRTNPQSELDFESFVENSLLDKLNRLREAALQRAPKTSEPEKGLFGFDEEVFLPRTGPVSISSSDETTPAASESSATLPAQPGQIYFEPDSQRSYYFKPIRDSFHSEPSTSRSSEEQSYSQEILSLSSEGSLTPEDIAYIASAPDFRSSSISISDKKSATAPAQLEQTYFPSTSKESFDQKAVRPGTLISTSSEKEIFSPSPENYNNPVPLQRSKKVFNFTDLQKKASEQSRTYEGSGNSGSFIESSYESSINDSFVEFSTLISSTSYVSENLSVDDEKAPSYDFEDEKIGKIIRGLHAKTSVFKEKQETLSISPEKTEPLSLSPIDLKKSFPEDSSLVAKYTAKKAIDIQWEQVKRHDEEKKLRNSSETTIKKVATANPEKPSLQIPKEQDTTQSQGQFVVKRRPRKNNMLKRERFDHDTAVHIVGTPLEDIYKSKKDGRLPSKPIDLPSKPKVEHPNIAESSVQNSILNNAFQRQPNDVFFHDEDLPTTRHFLIPTPNNNPNPVERILSESYLTFEKKVTSRYAKESKQKPTLQRSNSLEEILSNPPAKSPLTIPATGSPKGSLLGEQLAQHKEKEMSKSPSGRQ